MSSSKGASFSESELEALGLWDVAEQCGGKKQNTNNEYEYELPFHDGLPLVL